MSWETIIQGVVVGASVGLIIMIITRITTPYYNRIDEQIKNSAVNNKSEQEKLYIELRQINDKLGDIKTERKEDRNELSIFRTQLETVKQDIVKLQSQWHQISQAVGEVDADKTKDINHVRAMFDLYKTVLDNFMKK